LVGIREDAMYERFAGTVNIRSVRCCVLFDRKDGTIRHVNRVVTVEGADATSEKEMEARTLRLAGSLGLDTTQLQPLHVSPESLVAGKLYRVDVKTRTLAERPRGESRRTGMAKPKTHAPRKAPPMSARQTSKKRKR
jgi:hypothetical protein